MKKLFHTSIAVIALALALPAIAEVVAVVNLKATESTLTKDQVAQVFLGKSNMFTPIDQPESAAVREEFYKKVTDRDPSQVKSVWSKLVFTGKAAMPKEVSDSAAVKKAVAADTKVIGYIEKSAVDASVKVAYSTQ